MGTRSAGKTLDCFVSDEFMIEHPDDVPGTIGEQIELYESSNGARGNAISGIPVVLMYTLGAKSGQIRKTPVLRVEHDGVYLVVGSVGGAPKSPAWVCNLRENPVLDLRDKDEVFPVHAEEVTDTKAHAQWWRRALHVFPQYAEYAERANRKIPIFTLTPTT